MLTASQSVRWRRYRAAGYLGLAALFGWLFYVRYWKWRDCINEVLSSCVTPEGDNLTAGGMVWAIFALAFAIAALRLVVRW